MTLIRELGPNWRIVTFTLVLYELIPHSIPAGTAQSFTLAYLNLDAHKVLVPYLEFLERIYSLNVQDAYDVKRLIPVTPLSCLLNCRATNWPSCLVGFASSKSQKPKKKLSSIRLSRISRLPKPWKRPLNQALSNSHSRLIPTSFALRFLVSEGCDIMFPSIGQSSIQRRE